MHSFCNYLRAIVELGEILVSSTEKSSYDSCVGSKSFCLQSVAIEVGCQRKKVTMVHIKSLRWDKTLSMRQKKRSMDSELMTDSKLMTFDFNCIHSRFKVQPTCVNKKFFLINILLFLVWLKVAAGPILSELLRTGQVTMVFLLQKLSIHVYSLKVNVNVVYSYAKFGFKYLRLGNTAVRQSNV